MLTCLKAGFQQIRRLLFDDDALVIESPGGLPRGQTFVAERRGNSWIVTRSGMVHYGPTNGPDAHQQAHKYARMRNHMLLAIENRRIRERYSARHHAS